MLVPVLQADISFITSPTVRTSGRRTSSRPSSSADLFVICSSRTPAPKTCTWYQLPAHLTRALHFPLATHT
jgi:hypothetical protein